MDRNLEWATLGNSMLEIAQAELKEAKRQLVLMTGRNQTLRTKCTHLECLAEDAQRDRFDAIRDIQRITEHLPADWLDGIDPGMSERFKRHARDLSRAASSRIRDN